MPHLISFRYVDGDADGVPKSDDVLSSRQTKSRDDQTNIYLGRNYTRRTDGPHWRGSPKNGVVWYWCGTWFLIVDGWMDDLSSGIRRTFEWIYGGMRRYRSILRLQQLQPQPPLATTIFFLEFWLMYFTWHDNMVMGHVAQDLRCLSPIESNQQHRNVSHNKKCYFKIYSLFEKYGKFE